MDITKKFNDKSIRIILKKGEPFFAAIDVCNILEIKNVSQALAYLEKDEVISSEVIDSLGRKQIASFINEGCLYQLIFRSRKKEAMQFKKWVTHEVLPSIRKTGKYSIPEKIKHISIKNRRAITDAWQENGVSKPHEFIQLTLQEYKSLKFDNNKRKKEMTKEEILLLSALESMESLNLFYNPQEDFHGCAKSLTKTAAKVIECKSPAKKISQKN